MGPSRVDRLVRRRSLWWQACRLRAPHIGADIAAARENSTLVGDLCAVIELACLLEVFLGQLGHTEILEPASEHPMVKRIIRSELIGLFFVSACFFEFT